MKLVIYTIGGLAIVLFTFILRFTTTTKKTRKAHNKHLEQNKTPLTEDQIQINS